MVDHVGMIPLEYILKDVFIMVKEHDISEYDVLEWATQGLGLLHSVRTYQTAVCIQEVNNHIAKIPDGAIGIHHVRYMPSAKNEPEQVRLMLQQVNFITDKRMDMKCDGSPTKIPLHYRAQQDHQEDAWMDHNHQLHHDPVHNHDGHHGHPDMHDYNHHHGHPSPHHHGHQHNSPWDFTREIHWDKHRDFGYVTGVLTDTVLRTPSPNSSPGWQYLHISDQPFDKSILCDKESRPCKECEDWWLPDRPKNRIVTSFSEGLIAISYYRYPMNEEGMFLIPDIPIFKEALYHYVMMKFSEKRMLSKEDNSMSLYSLYSKKWSLLYRNARSVVFTPSLSEIINLDRNNTMFRDYDIRTIAMGNHRNERMRL